MKKFILVLLTLPIISFAQFGDCVWGDCDKGYGIWNSHSTVVSNLGYEKSETIYTGTFKNSQFNGLGTMEFWVVNENGDLIFYNYEGSFVNGRVNGYCVLTKSSGYGDYWRFIGQWKDDARNGIGVHYNGDGLGGITESGYIGYWVNDKFIKKIADF